jgi:ParB family chromosome partitioning protein
VNIENRDDQIALYEKIVGQSLSVRATENAVKAFKEATTEKPANQKTKETPKFINDGAQELLERLSVKVAISTTGKSKGKITIPFHSEEEFKRIKKLITGA